MVNKKIRTYLLFLITFFFGIFSGNLMSKDKPEPAPVTDTPAHYDKPHEMLKNTVKAIEYCNYKSAIESLQGDRAWLSKILREHVWEKIDKDDMESFKRGLDLSTLQSIKDDTAFIGLVEAYKKAFFLMESLGYLDEQGITLLNAGKCINHVKDKELRKKLFTEMEALENYFNLRKKYLD